MIVIALRRIASEVERHLNCQKQVEILEKLLKKPELKVAQRQEKPNTNERSE